MSFSKRVVSRKRKPALRKNHTALCRKKVGVLCSGHGADFFVRFPVGGKAASSAFRSGGAAVSAGGAGMPSNVRAHSLLAGFGTALPFVVPKGE